MLANEFIGNKKPETITNISKLITNELPSTSKYTELYSRYIRVIISDSFFPWCGLYGLVSSWSAELKKREHKNCYIWQEITFTKQYTNPFISQKRAVDFKRQRVNDQRTLSLSYLNEPRSLISHIDFSRYSIALRYKHCFLLLEGVH